MKDLPTRWVEYLRALSRAIGSNADYFYYPYVPLIVVPMFPGEDDPVFPPARFPRKVDASMLRFARRIMRKYGIDT